MDKDSIVRMAVNGTVSQNYRYQRRHINWPMVIIAGMIILVIAGHFLEIP